MAGGMLGLDRPGLLDGAAKKEQLFRQRGLAGIRVADDSEGPSAADFFLIIIFHLFILTCPKKNPRLLYSQRDIEPKSNFFDGF